MIGIYQRNPVIINKGGLGLYAYHHGYQDRLYIHDDFGNLVPINLGTFQILGEIMLTVWFNV